MCCSAWPAVFSNTIVGVFEVLVENELRHTLFYQNRVGLNVSQDRENAWSQIVNDLVYRKLVNNVQPRSPQFMQDFRNFRGSQWETRGIDDEDVFSEVEYRIAGNPPRTLSAIEDARTANPGNCLIIPLLGDWDSIRLLNTIDTPSLLTNIRIALQIPVPVESWGSAVPAGSYGSAGPRFVFMQFDIYDIVIAERALGADRVLEQIQHAKRPNINHDVFAALDEFYRCPMAFCCFRSRDEGEAKPLAFSFAPMYPQTMCVYTLDGHDGNAPKLNQEVKLNHTIFVGSYLTPRERCAKINYTDAIPQHLAPYLLDHAMGVPVFDTYLNGDFVFSTQDVRNGVFSGLRQAPPFADQGANDGVMVLRREEEYVQYAR